MNARRVLLWIGIAVIAAYVGRVVVRLAILMHDPYGVMLRMDVGGYSPVNPPGSPMTDQHAADLARMNNEIGRRSSWSDEDEAWLLGVLAVPAPDPSGTVYTNERGTPTNLVWEAYFLHKNALSQVGTRLGLGVPTPEPVVEAFEVAVLVAMEHPLEGYRSAGMAAVWDAGWLDRPDVRAAIERIRDSDPEPRMRHTAERRLRLHDGQPDIGAIAVGEPCEGCPGHAEDGR
ncbi:MAG: hypothetical protein ACTS22_07600 [Phycisphaerales bacterium]